MEKSNRTNAPLPAQSPYGWSTDSIPGAVFSNARGGGAPRRRPSSTRHRPIESTLLYQKKIDNSSVRYRHDPRDRAALRAHVSWGLFIVMLVVLAFGPRLWVRHLGYRQVELAEKVEELTVVRDRLKVHRGRLQDLDRVAELAANRGLQETEESSYTWFAPDSLEAGSQPAVAQLFEGAEE